MLTNRGVWTIIVNDEREKRTTGNNQSMTNYRGDKYCCSNRAIARPNFYKGVIKMETHRLELDTDDYAELYDELLNEQGPVNIGGLTFDPADIVKEMDPTAYRCGLLDFVDGMELTERG